MKDAEENVVEEDVEEEVMGQADIVTLASRRKWQRVYFISSSPRLAHQLSHYSRIHTQTHTHKTHTHAHIHCACPQVRTAVEIEEEVGGEEKEEVR